MRAALKKHWIVVLRLRPFVLRILAIPIMLGCTLINISAAKAESTAKILHINSYHQGYQWSDKVTQGIQSRLTAEDVEFDVVHLDYSQTLRASHFEVVVDLAKKKIHSFKPDVIITSNDAAIRFMARSLLKDHDIPIIFTGLHSQAESVNYPKDKVTGIIEFAMVEQLVDLLEQYSQGKRLGLLSIESLSGRKTQNQYKNILKADFDQVYYARNFGLWKRYFNYLQDQVDLIILVDPTSLPDWDSDAALSFMQNNIRVPVGATDQWLAPLSLITIAKVPQEQGWWAADIAMKLIDGNTPEDFPISRTRDAKLIINFETAEQLNIIFSSELIEIGSKVHN